jgi:serine protease Do
MSALLQFLDKDTAELVARAAESLVRVSSGERGAGSGVIWHSDGLVVTNAHVLQETGSREHAPQVTLANGRTLAAHVLALDRRLDVAALYLAAEGLPSSRMGDSRSIRTGELVYAVGHPWGIANSFSAGAVVATGADWHERELAGREWVVTDLHLRPGNSGGPLLDSRGMLIGINAMTVGWTMGIAVPSHVVDRFLNMEGIRFNMQRDWMRYGSRSHAA